MLECGVVIDDNDHFPQLLLCGGQPLYTEPEYEKAFFTTCFFVGPNLRKAVDEGG